MLRSRNLTNREKEINQWFVRTAHTYKNNLTLNMTPYESELKLILDELNLSYECQHIIFIHDNHVIKKFYIADFFIPQLNLIIEADGGFHYEHEQKIKDIARDTELKRSKYNILRLYNKEILVEGNVKRKIEKYAKEYNN